MNTNQPNPADAAIAPFGLRREAKRHAALEPMSWKEQQRELSARARLVRGHRGAHKPGDRLQFSRDTYQVGPGGNLIKLQPARKP